MFKREGNHLENKYSDSIAKWYNGELVIMKTYWTIEEALQLAEFAVNPLKPKYRITRTFDEKPNIVVAGNITKIEVGRRDDVCASRVLTPSDIEEVWE